MSPKKTHKTVLPAVSSDVISARVGEMEKNLEVGISDLRKQLLDKDNIPAHVSNVNNLLKKLTTFENQFKDSISEIKMLINDYYEKLIDRLKQEMFFNGLVINGVPEKDTAQLSSEVCEIIKLTKLDITFTEDDINFCHRIGKTVNQTNPRPIAVYFINRWKRDIIFKLKKNLKGSKYVISELLTGKTLNLFKQVRTKFGVRTSWTWRGRIYVFVDGSVKEIQTADDLMV